MKPFNAKHPPVLLDALTSVWAFVIPIALIMVLYFLLDITPSFAASTLPGEDASSRMESAGTLLRFIDTSLFRWAARLLAGICIFGSAWSLKEGRYGPAVISVISAILFGTAPTWVKNIFSIGGSDSVFSQLHDPSRATPTFQDEDQTHA
jgi:hypothetical protein